MLSYGEPFEGWKEYGIGSMKANQGAKPNAEEQKAYIVS